MNQVNCLEDLDEGELLERAIAMSLEEEEEEEENEKGEKEGDVGKEKLCSVKGEAVTIAKEIISFIITTS